MNRNKYYILILFLLMPFKGVYSQEFVMPGYISDINSCDFDLNGGDDILVTCPYADTLIILFNNGYGEFEPYYYDLISLHAICGCIDEDSIPDLIAGAGQMFFFKSNGDYSFEDGVPVFTLSGTNSIYGLVDMNSDGWNDLVYTNTSSEFWAILKNNGDVTFTNEIMQTGSSTTIPGVGFITDDLLRDVVLSYSAFNRSSVNVNDGNFDFTEVIIEETFIGEAFVMNLDNQGTDDFAFANYYTKTIPLYKFIGNNQFELQSNFYAAGTYVISSFLPGDFNQDGFDDFAITRGDWGNDSDSLYIYFNDQNWSFNLNQTLYIGDLTWYKSCSSDLNGDSYPDIFMKGCNGNNIITLLWNDGFGNFSFENPVSVIDNQLSNNEFSVFPNPFSNQIEIKIPACKSMNLQVIITNVLGQNVQLINLSNPDKTEELFYHWDGCDISGLACPPGIYLITVRHKSNKITKKVVKL